MVIKLYRKQSLIDFGRKVFEKGQFYITLSHVKSFEGVALYDLNLNKLLIKPHDKKPFAEFQRL